MTCPPIFYYIAAAGAVLLLLGRLFKGKLRGLCTLWGLLLLSVAVIFGLFFVVCGPFLEVNRRGKIIYGSG